MQTNTAYKVSFWANLAQNSFYSVDPSSLGIFISSPSCAPKTLGTGYYLLRDCNNLSINQTNYPTQLITGVNSGTSFSTIGKWVQIRGTYTSVGNENTITIGNFNNNSTGVYNTTGYPVGSYAYYYIDDVSIIKTILASASPQTICADSGTGTTLSATNGFTTYTWYPGTLTGQSVTVHPITNTTYTVIATDGTCTDTSTIAVYITNCCTPNCAANAHGTSTKNYSSGLYIPSGTASSTIDGSTTTISGCASSGSSTSVAITGPFTINGICTFRNVNVAMSAYSQIIVSSGSTLNIHSSRFYACDTMWQGIVVQPGGTLLIDSSSIIEDAQLAIEGKNGGAPPSITVLNSELNNNYVDIKADPCAYSVAYPLTLHNVTFTTSSDPFSSNNYLKAPYAGDSTYIGVEVDTVTGNIFGQEAITIGDAGNSAYLNHFSNMKYGVFSLSSNFAVFNNSFSTLKGYLNFVGIPNGVGVFADANTYDTTNVGTYYTAIVGSSGANYANTFTNCFRGVDVTDYVHLQVDSNFMSCTSNLTSGASGYGDHAIFFKIQGQDSILFELDKNTINNYYTGIHVLGVTPAGLVPPNGFAGTACYINSNYIHANTSGTLGVGIELENVYYPGRYSDLVYIQGNKIDSAKYCIYTDENGTKTQITSNPDLLVMPSASSNNTLKAGIYIAGDGYDMAVQSNPAIHADGTYIGAAAAADTDVVGIYLDIATPGICSNNMYKLGQAMKFRGACSSTVVTSNSMDTTYDGLVLDMNGVIGTQPTLYTSGAGDTWGTDFYNSQTATYSSNATNSPLYLAALPSSNYTNDVPGTDNYTSGISLFTQSGTAPCLGGLVSGVQDPSPQHGKTIVPDSMLLIKDMHKIIYDSIQLMGLVSETRYIMKQQLYEQLDRSSNLLTEDTALANFYARNQQSNMGYLYEVKKAIIKGNYTLANSIISTLAPQNSIEQNHKDVYTIMLNTVAKRIYTATQAQLAIIRGIANQCPLSGGRAVFEARVLLNALLNTSILYSDSACYGENGGGQHKRIIKQNAINNIASVYPNPANTIMNVKINLQPNQVDEICMFNSIGEKVICKELTENLTELPTSTIAQGIYYYRITDTGGNLIKSDKIMITH